MRDKWTDERLDDLSKHLDDGFRDLRGDIRDLRAEMRGLRTETNGGFERVDARLDALNRTILQVGGGLAGAVIVGLIGLIATQL